MTAKICDNPSTPKVKQLPPWKVILHNDSVNEIDYVVKKIIEITHLEQEMAIKKAKEAHDDGKSILVFAHKEKAELYVDQFKSYKIQTSMEQL